MDGTTGAGEMVSAVFASTSASVAGSGDVPNETVSFEAAVDAGAPTVAAGADCAGAAGCGATEGVVVAGSSAFAVASTFGPSVETGVFSVFVGAGTSPFGSSDLEAVGDGTAGTVSFLTTSGFD